jgi:hypothetical protein
MILLNIRIAYKEQQQARSMLILTYDRLLSISNSSNPMPVTVISSI